jgi:hypothetical protein
MSYARLGSIDDPLAEDFDVSTPSDPRAAYVEWAAAVKRYGGTVTAAPHTTAQVNKGDAAAAYPTKIISPAPTYALNPLFHHWPDDWSSNGNTGYFRAPASVLAYTAGRPRNFWDVGTWFGSTEAPITATQTAPGESAPADPKWYDDFKGMLKSGGWIVGGLLALSALSFLPRRRD